MLSMLLVLADLQGHHECTALAITIFRRSGTYYARNSDFSGEISLPMFEDLKRANRHSTWPQAAVPNRTAS
jgi:hypothetical protein